MTKDQVIAWAREAGYHKGVAQHDIELLTRFAALVRNAALEESRAEVERLKEMLRLAEQCLPYDLPLSEAIRKVLASGAAHTSKTIDVKWHHDLAPAPKPPSSFEAEAALVAQRKAFMGSR